MVEAAEVDVAGEEAAVEVEVEVDVEAVADEDTIKKFWMDCKRRR